MSTERVLSLDISTKTGWALLVSNPDGVTLEAYGKIAQIPEPIGEYPGNYVQWAYMCFNKLTDLIAQYKPDVLVIEETASGSKNVYSQKILEYTHFLTAQMIATDKLKVVYMLTEQWRRETGCVMTKEEKDNNKAVKKFKEKSGTKVAYNADGKRIGKKGRKHVNVRRANEVFADFLEKPLKQVDEDKADALLLAYAYHMRRIKGSVIQEMHIDEVLK